MIVQCPHCSARYRVNEANIPASGGRIKCPSCQSSFVVYPEAPEPEPAAPAGGFDEDKTSVASMPDLQMLRNAAQAAAKAQEEEEPSGATEVMGGDALPNFASLFGQKQNPGNNDGTVEIQNPLAFAASWQASQQASNHGDEEEESGATEVISSELVFNAQAFGRQGAVRKDAEAAKPAAISQPAQRPAQPAPQPAAPIPQPQRPGPSLSSSLFDDMTGEQAPPLGLGGLGGAPPVIAPPVSEPPAASSGVDPAHDGPWKLKTNFGLTYEFTDTKSLLNWMSSRDELDGYTLSADGQTFLPIQEFPQVMVRNKRSGATQAMRAQVAPPSAADHGQGFGPGPGFGQDQGFQQGPPRPTSPSKVIQPKVQLQSRDANATKVLWGIFIIMLPVALVLVLHAGGVINVKALLGLEAPAPQQPVTPTPEVAKEPAPAPAQDTPPAPAELTAEQKAQVDALVEDARIALKNNKLRDASDKLDTARQLDANRFEIYDLQAEVFDKIGDKDKAEATRQEVLKLRSAAAPADDGADPDVPAP